MWTTASMRPAPRGRLDGGTTDSPAVTFIHLRATVVSAKLTDLRIAWAQPDILLPTFAEKASRRRVDDVDDEENAFIPAESMVARDVTIEKIDDRRGREAAELLRIYRASVPRAPRLETRSSYGRRKGNACVFESPH